MAGNFGSRSLTRVGMALQDALTEGPTDPEPDRSTNPSR